MVPKHSVYPDEKKAELYKKYNITKDSEIPQISRFDPVAQAIGLRPGQICEIIRSSPTSITSVFYRFCVQ